jgi:hypothetical protein
MVGLYGLDMVLYRDMMGRTCGIFGKLGINSGNAIGI